MNQFKDCLLLLLIIRCPVFAFSPTDTIVVDCQYSGEAGASINGKNTYKTVGEALHSKRGNENTPLVIRIRKGIYREKLSVDIGNVRFLGENRDSTIITWDATADSRDPAGKPCGTQGSFTLRVTKPDFSAENLTIENGFDYPGNAAIPDGDETKIENAQAVALMTSAGSDRAAFSNCVIRGYQDTLFPDSGRHYFNRCRILGHVDFIFGAGQAVFEDCDIVSRNREGKNPTGYVTAPSTSICHPYGFLFIGCRLLKETPDIPAGSVRLGRPWHPKADPKADGSAVFVRCTMDDHIGSLGYAPISSRDSTGQKIVFDLEKDSRFFEYESYGPGAVKSSRRPVLDENAAAWYTVGNALNGWKPETGRTGD
jgi:pectinesterase